MLILNFTRKLTPPQIVAIAEAMNVSSNLAEVRERFAHFTDEEPYGRQATEFVDNVGLAKHDWQTRRIVVVLPGLAAAAAVMLAELHGRMGYFPPVVRIRQGAEQGQWDVAEVLDLRSQRDGAARESH